MIELTEAQFEAQFTVVPDTDGQEIRPDLTGIDPSSAHLWTVTDDDDGNLYATSGSLYVNRLGYLITKEAWVQSTNAVYYENDIDDEEDDVELLPCGCCPVQE